MVLGEMSNYHFPKMFLSSNFPFEYSVGLIMDPLFGEIYIVK